MKQEYNARKKREKRRVVIRSGTCEEVKAAYFHYSPSCSGRIAKQQLFTFNGYLTTDAYIGYEQIENIKRNLCWAHVRRYYIERIPLDSNGKEISHTKGAEVCEYIKLLFKIESEIKDLSYEEKKEKRQGASKPLLEAFWLWVDETAAKFTTNEKLRKVLNYSKNQKKYLETFLEDRRLPISNNLCEANIKPFAMGNERGFLQIRQRERMPMRFSIP